LADREFASGKRAALVAIELCKIARWIDDLRNDGLCVAAANALLKEALGAEAQLFGRRTYEFLAARWPSRGGELADRLNDMPKYVVSSTLESLSWNNTTVLKGDVVNEGSKLKQQLGGEIVVAGSIQLVRTLIENDLYDELRLMIYPIVLGEGERLFGATSERKAMRLITTRTVDNDLANLRYQTVRDA